MKYWYNYLLLGIFTLVIGSCSNPTKHAELKKEKEADSTAVVKEKEEVKDTIVTDFVTVGGDTVDIDPNLSKKERQRVMTLINKEYLMGQFDPAEHPAFSKVDDQYLVYPKRQVYMRTEAMEAFLKLRQAALDDGISFKIMSATRPFNVQKSIWERKWKGESQVNFKYVSQSAPAKDKAEQILEWNSMPSTSRHHWGTDIDINSVNPKNWETKTGKIQYQWLVDHANEFGFCQVYSAGRPYGYQEEKWHWSYMPLAKKFTDQYAKQITDQDISGFLGAETAVDIEVVKKYVLGINPDCL